MIDQNLLKEDSFHLVKENLRKRNYELSSDPSALLSQRKKIIMELEEYQHKRNVLSKEIARLKSKNDQQKVVDTQRVQEEVSQISRGIQELKSKLSQIETGYQAAILNIPNMLESDVPEGASENDNILIKQEGEIPEYSFKVKPHDEIARNLGLIDFERGVKLAGSRFYIYNERIAALERNLMGFMLNIHQKKGYRERMAPLLVKDECMQNTGQLPRFRDEYYHLANEELSLIPTAEVSLTNIFSDEILTEAELPIYLSAATPCFRKEAGAAGKDTRGIIRVHQFQKVELVKFVKPEESPDELEKLLRDAEDILKKFSLTYRIMLLCSQDTGFSSAKTYDLEIWFPGSQRWVEISSCSNFKDFQSRRAKIRYKETSTGKNHLVHTLNGSGVAAGRLVAAFLEYYQTPQGEIKWDEIDQIISG